MALPNTDDCPVKQRCYDWAQHNKDKLVVLWYSSSRLDSEEERTALYNFQKKSLYDGITNILILDVDKINWGDEKRHRYGFEEKTEISNLLVFDDKQLFCQVLDGYRPALLSRGSSCIKSAMRQSHITEAEIPTRGAYFDMDYIPIPFKTFYHPRRQICRDGTFDTIGFCDGRLYFRNIIPNSFLASDEDNNEMLTDFPLAKAFAELSRCACYNPHLVATTTVFRMSDCTYTDNGNLIKWERNDTWNHGYSDKTISRPLSIDKPPIPEYLAKYLASSSSKSDPMVQR